MSAESAARLVEMQEACERLKQELASSMKQCTELTTRFAFHGRLALSLSSVKYGSSIIRFYHPLSPTCVELSAVSSGCG